MIVTASRGSELATATAYIVGNQIPDAVITAKLISIYKGPTPNLMTGIAQTESSYRQFAERTLKKTISVALGLLWLCVNLAAEDLRGRPARIPVIAENMSALEVADLIDAATSHRFVRGRVVDFRVTDVDGDGKPELIALVDMSGRGHERLFAISQTPHGLSAFSLVAWRLDSLGGVLRDLNGDGKQEVVVPRVLTPYGGGYPPAEYPAVYVLTTQGFVDRSSSFTTYYLGELPRIEQRIADLGFLQGEQDIALRDALIAERDIIVRITGRDPAAGLTTAEQWAADKEPRRRILAAVVLRDIGGSRARATLEKLARDPNREVAEASRLRQLIE